MRPRPQCDQNANGRPTPRHHNIQRAIKQETQRVHELPRRRCSRPPDGARHVGLDGQLKLAEEHLNLLKTIAAAIGSQDEEGASLEEQIGKLEETVQDAGAAAKPAGAPAVAAVAAAAAGSADGGGIAGLASEIYRYVRMRQEVKALYTRNTGRAFRQSRAAAPRSTISCRIS